MHFSLALWHNCIMPERTQWILWTSQCTFQQFCLDRAFWHNPPGLSTLICTESCSDSWVIEITLFSLYWPFKHLHWPLDIWETEKALMQKSIAHKMQTVCAILMNGNKYQQTESWKHAAGELALQAVCSSSSLKLHTLLMSPSEASWHRHEKRLQPQVMTFCEHTWSPAGSHWPALRQSYSSTSTSASRTWTSSSLPHSCPHPSPPERPGWLRSWRTNFSETFCLNSSPSLCWGEVTGAGGGLAGLHASHNGSPTGDPLIKTGWKDSRSGKKPHGWVLLTGDSCSWAAASFHCAVCRAQVWRHAPEEQHPNPDSLPMTALLSHPSTDTHSLYILYLYIVFNPVPTCCLLLRVSFLSISEWGQKKILKKYILKNKNYIIN